jgi:hypothetical protein
MSNVRRLRIGGGGGLSLRLHFRGVAGRLRVELSGREAIQMAILIVIMVVVFVLAMYFGWWTLKQESTHQEHGIAELRQQSSSGG